MKKIIVDTNALMAVSDLSIDIFSALEEACNFKFKIFVLQGTIDELHKIIAEQRGKFKRAAKLGLSLVEAKNLGIIESSGNVDDALVEYSKKGYLVLTQDVLLKKRLSKPYLTIRQKNKIILV